MRNHLPQIELTPGNHRVEPAFSESPSWLKSKRMLIFLIAFSVTLVVAMSYVLGRSSIYRSHATLLTVAKTAVDQRSDDIDIQHVAIQKQLLLGAEMLAEMTKRLSFHPEIKTVLTAADIRSLLDVRSVADTNLIEIVAEGSNPKLLPILVNTWLEVYLEAREKEMARSTGDTTQRIQTEITGLTEKIAQKRAELEQFRDHHQIVSTGREENEALARLKGLNDSLNKSVEEEVKAKARLDSIKKSIAKGQAVVPKEDTQKLAILEKRAQELKEELADLDRRYTREYMALTPSLKVIPEKIATLQTEIQQLRSAGQTIVLAEADQDYTAALQASQAIREQLAAHKKKAAEFTARFTEHEALKTDLEGLEQKLREAQERLVQVETKYNGKFPQVDVVERATTPVHPIWPDYTRDSLIALVSALIMGLIAVWVVEFLTRKEKAKLAINLSGVHIYGSEDAARQVVNPLPLAQPRLLDQQSVQPALIGGMIQEVPPKTIQQLFQAGNPKEQQLIALLMSGLTLDEIATLNAKSFDLENNQLSLSGTHARTVRLNPVLKKLLQADGYHLMSNTGQALSLDDLAVLLTCTIIDAGLTAADGISAEALRQTYLLFLIRQSVRLSDLEQIVGYIAPAELSTLSQFAPPGPKFALQAINLFYPLETL